jgi:hypothetical protein
MFLLLFLFLNGSLQVPSSTSLHLARATAFRETFFIYLFLFHPLFPFPRITLGWHGVEFLYIFFFLLLVTPPPTPTCSASFCFVCRSRLPLGLPLLTPTYGTEREGLGGWFVWHSSVLTFYPSISVFSHPSFSFNCIIKTRFTVFFVLFLALRCSALLFFEPCAVG